MNNDLFLKMGEFATAMVLILKTKLIDSLFAKAKTKVTFPLSALLSYELGPLFWQQLLPLIKKI